MRSPPVRKPTAVHTLECSFSLLFPSLGLLFPKMHLLRSATTVIYPLHYPLGIRDFVNSTAFHLEQCLHLFPIDA